MKLNLHQLPVFVLLLVFAVARESSAQQHLHRRMSMAVKEQPAGKVLEEIGKKGNFSFSYSGGLFKSDSLVSLTLDHAPVWQILDQLFQSNVEYREAGDYIILRKAINRFYIVSDEISSTKNSYRISGQVMDAASGTGVAGASVYEKRLLQSALTDKNGSFKLRFRGEHFSVILTTSKENYRDTSMIFLSDVKVMPEGVQDRGQLDFLLSGANAMVERLGIGRFFVSSRRRIQSLNIPGFFANSPFQASLLPGIGSHGLMSSQVVNKGSLNLLGGYAAGVDGVEVAGLFNITKNNVENVQVAGLFNAVGGAVNGVQVAGTVNYILDSVAGVQVAGLANHVRQDVSGVQVSGLLNHSQANVAGVQVAGLSNIVYKSMEGTQVSGLVNLVVKESKAVQVAGLANLSLKEIKGTQIAGLVNYAKVMDGLQIGLVNLADSSSGYSIGLLNLFRKGYHKIDLYADDLMTTNVAFKTGNARLYTQLIGGANLVGNQKLYAAGFGMGHDFKFSNKLLFSAAISSKVLFTGNSSYFPVLYKANGSLSYQLFKNLSLFAGPAYNFFNGDASLSVAQGYKDIVPEKHHSYSANSKGWLGWSAGITLF
jgi:hypothetical protein